MAGGQQRITGHVSLKQTVRLRGQSETPPFLNSITKEPQNSICLPFHQRSSSDNTANYVPYSPYALRRKEISRPFSPQMTKDNHDSNLQRSFSPYRHFVEHKDFVSSRISINGQSRQDGRPFSPYKQEVNYSEIGTRPYSPYHTRYDERDSSRDRCQTAPRSLSPFTRDYSPWRRENVDPPGVIQPLNENGRYSPFVQHQIEHPPVPQTHPQSQDIYGSPMISRKRFPSEPPPQGAHSTHSPQLLISRFAHQLKQESPPSVPQVQVGSKESAKKRFASYVRLRLGSDRAPSPEPPPRLSRGESPLALRRNVVDQPSPSFSRRYVSPSPPQPPPRRLSGSCSVPGSPQHVRAHLRYTPEPQRRPTPP